MPKQKLPDLSDWEVSFVAGAAYPRSPLVIRATRLRAAPGWAILEDTQGRALFMAQRELVLCVRHLEPGEPAEAIDALKTVDVPLPEPESAAAETVATPAQRRKRGGAHS